MSEQKKAKRGPFKKFFYRGYEVHQLVDLGQTEMKALFHARARRHFKTRKKPWTNKFLQRLIKAKKKAAPGTKPEIIKTHLRNMIIRPEMVASLVGVYNGKGYILVEIKPDMVGHYLGEFALTYQPVKHGRPGTGNVLQNRFIPIK
uniref:40S ribosomal protein S15 n=1 Tax=Lotharella oceanica TaxID=641309 RepID=A0A7S2TZN3_9EUKA|mmetsp:Transcript_373/g.699  ORF Transcript_373/g.699 Transcript_373/m.699 type:complete len:146 (+) Transcript_373:34-471(+)